jgi:hypothetical protein
MLRGAARGIGDYIRTGHARQALRLLGNHSETTQTEWGRRGFLTKSEPKGRTKIGAWFLSWIPSCLSSWIGAMQRGIPSGRRLVHPEVVRRSYGWLSLHHIATQSDTLLRGRRRDAVFCIANRRV